MNHQTVSSILILAGLGSVAVSSSQIYCLTKSPL